MLRFILINWQCFAVLILFVLLFTALFTAFYFFVYKYLIKKRIEHPEKHHRLKLVSPKIACIILLLISIICSIFIGGNFYWITHADDTSMYSYNEYKNSDFTEDKIKANKNNECATQILDDFVIKLYKNNDYNKFSRPINGNNEYIIYIYYTGDDVNNYAGVDVNFCNEEFESQMGISADEKLNNFPMVFLGTCDDFKNAKVEIKMMTPENYKTLNDTADIQDLLCYKKITLKINLDELSFVGNNVIMKDDTNYAKAVNSALSQICKTGDDYSKLYEDYKEVIPEHIYKEMNFKAQKNDIKSESFNWTYPQISVIENNAVVYYKINYSYITEKDNKSAEDSTVVLLKLSDDGKITDYGTADNMPKWAEDFTGELEESELTETE